MSKIKSDNMEEIFPHTESKKVGDNQGELSVRIRSEEELFGLYGDESSDTSRVNENSIIQENMDLQNPSYINMTFHRSQLVVLEQWFSSLNISEATSNLSEDSKYLAIAALRGFYSDICKALYESDKLMENTTSIKW